jgi:hypothetical protein
VEGVLEGLSLTPILVFFLIQKAELREVESTMVLSKAVGRAAGRVKVLEKEGKISVRQEKQVFEL